MENYTLLGYSLYLVTDSTPAILKNRDFFHIVEEALKGGVTCVQLRDKTSDTGELIEIGRRLHRITQAYCVPLLINDRVDVALAVGCEGVHVGQDDMSLAEARRLLGTRKIIGVSAGTASEAIEAAKGGADYIGIGTIFATKTKTNTKNILGVEGVKEILQALENSFPNIQTVGIGGINETNVIQLMAMGATFKKRLDGVAVVSAIMGAEDPQAAAHRLVRHSNPKRNPENSAKVRTLVASAPDIIAAIYEKKPLSHNMTNTVVQNFAANVALAMGATPIMSSNGDEAEDICKNKGSLVINMGTVDKYALANYLKALRAYNQARQPVVFDPVGAGASAIRRQALKDILGAGYLDVIKGNESEIRTVFGKDQSLQRGVDSLNTMTIKDRVDMVRELALCKKTVVVMTGETDVVSDGVITVRIDNGHRYLSEITGSGCALGTAISAAVAAWPEDKLAATIAAMLHYEIAAERAAEAEYVNGPGTFQAAFIDSLYKIRNENARGNWDWLQGAKVQPVEH